MTQELGHEEFELLARVAHRYHVDEQTQEAIAREMGLSRPKVQRLLERARAKGVVEVRVETPPWLHLELEALLRTTFGLHAAIVTPARADIGAQREETARAAARYLENQAVSGSVVAVSHGRDAAEVARFFRPGRQIDCTFVSAMGGSPHLDSPVNPNEICRTLADRCGGRAVSLYAPAVLASSQVRDQLLQEEVISGTLDLAGHASLALVGIGGVDDDCTMVRSGCFSVEEIRQLRKRGAVGDVLGNYVDAAGAPVPSPEASRLIGLSLADVRRIGAVIAVVSEAEKPRAVLGALRSGAIDVLVVDERNAREVLALAGRAERDATAARPSHEAGS